MTIEERAREQEKTNFSKEEFDLLREVHGVNSAYGVGYFLGATEQRKIDVDKACEWLKENVEKYLFNSGGFEEYIPTCGDKLYTDFRKAMEI